MQIEYTKDNAFTRLRKRPCPCASGSRERNCSRQFVGAPNVSKMANLNNLNNYNNNQQHIINNNNNDNTDVEMMSRNSSLNNINDVSLNSFYNFTYKLPQNNNHNILF